MNKSVLFIVVVFNFVMEEGTFAVNVRYMSGIKKY